MVFEWAQKNVNGDCTTHSVSMGRMCRYLGIPAGIMAATTYVFTSQYDNGDPNGFIGRVPLSYLENSEPGHSMVIAYTEKGWEIADSAWNHYGLAEVTKSHQLTHTDDLYDNSGWYSQSAALKPSSARIEIDGKSVVGFTAVSYNGNNYIGIRDFAALLSKYGSRAYDVGYRQIICLYPGIKSDTSSRSAQLPSSGGSGQAVTNEHIVVWGVQYNNASTVSYNGVDYYNLIDICKFVDINYAYDKARDTIIINTTASYSTNTEAATPANSNGRKVGDKLDDVLRTDIRAYINGSQIPARNIGGSMYVFAADLRSYGFEVTYDDAARATTITLAKGKAFTPLETAKTGGKVGDKIGSVLYTDIKTYILGKEVTSVNVDGKTAIPFAELKAFGEVKYDNATRSSTVVIK